MRTYPGIAHQLLKFVHKGMPVWVAVRGAPFVFFLIVAPGKVAVAKRIGAALGLITNRVTRLVNVNAFIKISGAFVEGNATIGVLEVFWGLEWRKRMAKRNLRQLVRKLTFVQKR